MPKRFIHFTFIFLLITALAGTLMRYFILFPEQSFLPYDHLLHGHSHVAILGWAFLGVFVIFLKLTWENLSNQKRAIQIATTTFIITLLMFLAFLYQGYAVFSIIFSTLHIFAEYWVARFMWKEIKQNTMIPKVSQLFLKGSILSLLVSTIGPFTLGGLGMAKLKDTPFFDMTIYVYLHFQYNGWLFLALIGLLIFILNIQKVTFNQVLLKYSFWIYFIALFPGLVLTILWFGLGPAGFLLSVIGATGQLLGVFLLIYTFFENINAIKNSFSRHILISLLFLMLLLASKSAMELGLLHVPFAELIFGTRSVIIGYLHLALLGFISILIFIEMQILKILDENKRGVLYGMGIFIVGFLINEFALFGQGLSQWLNLSLPYINEVLLISSIVLTISIVRVWLTTFNTSFLKDDQLPSIQKNIYKMYK